MNIYTQAVPSALREANSKVFRLVGPSASRLALMTPCGPSKSHKLIFMKEMLVGAVGIELKATLKARKFRTPDIAPKSFQYASFSRGGCEPKTVRFLRL